MSNLPYIINQTDLPFLPEDKIDVEDIVRYDEEHALVSQEDQPLPAQPV